MKAPRILCLIVMSICIAVSLGTCTLLGTDIHERIDLFIAGLNNSDRSAINSNFDQSLTQNLPTMTPAWWGAFFPVPPDADHLYFASLIDYSNPSNVVATIMGPPAFTSDTGVPLNAVFVMSKEGADWYIQKLYLNGSSTPIIQ